jgi:translation initiation factor 3 subunit H
MMKNLRDVNVDNNMVGWYQSTYLGSFLSDSVFVETQLSYQENLSEFVVIVYGMSVRVLL